MNNQGFLKDVGHGILLNQEEENILKKYEIPYLNCQNTKELIFKIEDFLNDFYDELEDLEKLSLRLSEYSYYQETRK